MFTDIVGYTTLGQENESAALELLERQRQLIRPLFSKHAGHEIKTMGDAFLVEFVSALEATLCAIDIESTIHSRNLERGEKLQVRIGIHVGDVMHQGGDVLGDSVNVASRIEPLAAPGGICISEQVYDQVKNKVSYPFNRLETRQLKNVKDSIEVYRIVMPWDEESVIQPAQLDRKRIAVLPFANISQDPNDEYFADGMTEELITAMSGLQGLQIIARTSVMNYKGGGTKLSTIGSDLGVGTVLEGSVRKAGNKVRVTAQLIDVPTASHLWSEKYDRELDDIFKIQDDIAGKIAEALKVRLVSLQGSGRKQTENMEAYTLYLKGRVLWNKRNKEGVMTALSLFQEALKLDSQYAKTWSGLADAYNIASSNEFMDREEALPKAKEAALKALELDDGLAEAHASLGLIHLNDLKYYEALRELKRAIELNPSYATAHHWYSLCLVDMGRIAVSLDEIKRAHELDPLSPMIASVIGRTMNLLGNLDEAITLQDNLIKREPDFANGYLFRSFSYFFKNMRDKALEDLESWHKIERDDYLYKVFLAWNLGWLGDIEKANLLIQEAIQNEERSSVVADLIALYYAIIGKGDEFFAWTEKAISTKNLSLDLRRYTPICDKVRSDPRFPEIFRKLGLPYEPDPK